MNLLAFDTSTETLRAAVARGGAPVLEHEAAGGPQASGTLIPLLLALLARAGLQLAQLDALVFGRGPGSFTGLRTACSVAQGFAFGAGIPVLGVDTLLAVAEAARHRTGATRVLAMLDARMDEVYAGRYVHDAGAWRREGEIVLVRPGAVPLPQGWVRAGNMLEPRVEAAPSASAMLRLAPGLLAAGEAHDAAHALPLYIRDKVAQTTEERAHARRLAAAP